MKPEGLIDSFNCAIEGLFYVLRTQKNMKFHVVAAIVIFISGVLLGFSRIEMLVLTLTIVFVLFAEISNTCIELIVDIVSPTFHPLAKIVKDICAGMVLLSAINALIVGYLLFLKPLVSHQVGWSLEAIMTLPWYSTLLCLIGVIMSVVLLKFVFRRGTPLHGGMPSGHAAVAFSLWTVVSLLTQHELVIVLVFILAFLVAQSRVVKKVHTFSEVLVGALLGILISLVIFQLMRVR